MIVIDAVPYVINVATGADYIVLSWRSVSHYSFLLRDFQVMVTSECPTGIRAFQTQIYNVSSEDNSLIIGNLGILIGIEYFNDALKDRLRP